MPFGECPESSQSSLAFLKSGFLSGKSSKSSSGGVTAGERFL